MNYLSIAFRTQVLNLVSLLFIAFMAMPFVSEAQNQKTIIASDTVVIIGCFAQLKPEEIAKFEGVDLVLGATCRNSNLCLRLWKNLAWT